MQVALDLISVHARIRERSALVRAKVFDREKFSGDVVQSYLAAVFQPNGRTFARRHGFGLTDRDLCTGSSRFTLVLAKFSHLLMADARP